MAKFSKIGLLSVIPSRKKLSFRIGLKLPVAFFSVNFPQDFGTFLFGSESNNFPRI
jgi:hypothetical protein